MELEMRDRWSQRQRQRRNHTQYLEMETGRHQKDSLKVTLCLKLLLNQRLRSLTSRIFSLKPLHFHSISLSTPSWVTSKRATLMTKERSAPSNRTRSDRMIAVGFIVRTGSAGKSHLLLIVFSRMISTEACLFFKSYHFFFNETNICSAVFCSFMLLFFSFLFFTFLSLSSPQCSMKMKMT